MITFDHNTYFSMGAAWRRPWAARAKPSELIPLRGEADPLPTEEMTEVVRLGGGGGGGVGPPVTDTALSEDTSSSEESRGVWGAESCSSCGAKFRHPIRYGEFIGESIISWILREGGGNKDPDELPISETD